MASGVGFPYRVINVEVVVDMPNIELVVVKEKAGCMTPSVWLTYMALINVWRIWSKYLEMISFNSSGYYKNDKIF